jgi:hypothetical protein
MPPLFRKIFVLALLLLHLHGFGWQLPAQRAPSTNALSVRQLARESGYIFAGTVTAVERLAASAPNEVATVRITFWVERAVRGVRAGQVLVIREWAGLWESGERYRTGERVLLFLYHPSKLGLTSPVGGPLGRFAVDHDGQVVLERTRAEALSLDPELATRLRGKSRVSGQDLARAIRRAAQE